MPAMKPTLLLTAGIFSAVSTVTFCPPRAARKEVSRSISVMVLSSRRSKSIFKIPITDTSLLDELDSPAHAG